MRTMTPFLEGRRCRWNGHIWAVTDSHDNILKLIRAIVPMEKYETEWVPLSEVEFNY